MKKTGFPSIQHTEERKIILSTNSLFCSNWGGGGRRGVITIQTIFQAKGVSLLASFFGYWGISSQSNLWRNQSYVMPILALISNLSTKYFRTVLCTPPRDFEPHMIIQIAAFFTSVQRKYVGVWISLTLVTLKGALKRGRSEALPQKQYSHWSYGRFMYGNVFSILHSRFWMERKNKIIWDE